MTTLHMNLTLNDRAWHQKMDKARSKLVQIGGDLVRVDRHIQHIQRKASRIGQAANMLHRENRNKHTQMVNRFGRDAGRATRKLSGISPEAIAKILTVLVPLLIPGAAAATVAVVSAVALRLLAPILARSGARMLSVAMPVIRKAVSESAAWLAKQSKESLQFAGKKIRQAGSWMGRSIRAVAAWVSKSLQQTSASIVKNMQKNWDVAESIARRLVIEAGTKINLLATSFALAVYKFTGKVLKYWNHSLRKQIEQTFGDDIRNKIIEWFRNLNHDREPEKRKPELEDDHYPLYPLLQDSWSRGYAGRGEGALRQLERVAVEVFGQITAMILQMTDVGVQAFQSMAHRIQASLIAQQAAAPRVGEGLVATSGLERSGGLLGTIASVAFRHQGGMVGTGARQNLVLSLQDIARAPRLHRGGLRSDEELTVLQRGEGVFTPHQMENANGVLRAALAGSGGKRPVTVNLTIISGDGERTTRQEQAQEDAQGRVMMEVNLRRGIPEEIAGSILRRQGSVYHALTETFGTSSPLR